MPITALAAYNKRNTRGELAWLAGGAGVGPDHHRLSLSIESASVAKDAIAQ